MQTNTFHGSDSLITWPRLKKKPPQLQTSKLQSVSAPGTLCEQWKWWGREKIERKRERWKNWKKLNTVSECWLIPSHVCFLQTASGWGVRCARVGWGGGLAGWDLSMTQPSCPHSHTLSSEMRMFPPSRPLSLPLQLAPSLPILEATQNSSCPRASWVPVQLEPLSLIQAPHLWAPVCTRTAPRPVDTNSV